LAARLSPGRGFRCARPSASGGARAGRPPGGEAPPPWASRLRGRPALVMQAVGRPSQYTVAHAARPACDGERCHDSGWRHVISGVTLRAQPPAPLAGLACPAPVSCCSREQPQHRRVWEAAQSGNLGVVVMPHAGCNSHPHVHPAAGQHRARGPYLFAKRATGLAGRSSSSLSSAQTCQPWQFVHQVLQAWDQQHAGFAGL